MSIRLFCSVAAFLVAAVPTMACEGKKVLFEDDFAIPDDAWDGKAPNFVIEGGRAVFSPETSVSSRVLHGGTVFDKADICLTLKMPEVTAPDQTGAGVMFWSKDYSNHYVLAVDPAGQVAILRRIAGKNVSVLSWRKNPAVQTAPGTINVLRVTLDGARVTAYVNGVKVATVRGQPTEGDGQVGLYAESESARKNVWEFTNIKVTDVPQT